MVIRGVLLDVGGVLVVPHEEPIARALRAAGLPLGNVDFKRAHFAATASVDQGLFYDGETSPYIHGYVEALGLDIPDRQLATQALERLFAQPASRIWRRVLPDSLDGLRQLSERRLPLGIVSNSDGTVEQLLLENGICQVSEGPGVPVVAIIDSAVVGVAKPDSRIFALGVEQLGLLPNETAFVGDSFRFDVLGATTAGLLPVHFDPYQLCDDRGGHWHIRSIAELLAPS
jgi:putative hydrolase of the HAD superfamily